MARENSLRKLVPHMMEIGLTMCVKELEQVFSRIKHITPVNGSGIYSMEWELKNTQSPSSEEATKMGRDKDLACRDMKMEVLILVIG